LGRLSDQQKGIIEERLKTVDKDMVRRGLTPGFRLAALAAANGSADGSVLGQADGGVPGEEGGSSSSRAVGLGLRGTMAVAGTETSMAASALRHLHAEMAVPAAAAAVGGDPGNQLQYQRKPTDDG
jgi:hypothetical protein